MGIKVHFILTKKNEDEENNFRFRLTKISKEEEERRRGRASVWLDYYVQIRIRKGGSLKNNLQIKNLLYGGTRNYLQKT